MINCEHYAMLEFGTVCLTIDEDYEVMGEIKDGRKYGKLATEALEEYINNINVAKFSRINFSKSIHYITANFRVIVENNLMSHLQYITEPTCYHIPRVAVEFTMDRINSQSITRHRPMSFAQQSQRYCNYSKGKFGSEIIFCIPEKLYEIRIDWSNSIDPVTLEDMSPRLEGLTGEALVKELVCIDRGVSAWYDSCKKSEDDYMYLTQEQEWTAEEARSILINDTATIITVCGFTDDWRHMFDLRADDKTGKAHQCIKKLFIPLKEEFIKLGLYV